jgi:hypothetical protein
MVISGFITLFTICPFETKRESNFYFGLDLCLFTTVISFCPRMANRGSLLVLLVILVLVIRLDGDPIGLKIAFSLCRRTSLLCHLIVLSLVGRVFCVLSRFLRDFCPFVLFLSIPGILLVILVSVFSC